MSSRRATVLMSILLVLLLGYVYQSLSMRGYITQFSTPAPLPGKNSISGLKVYQDITGNWKVDLDYFYTGEPTPAHMRISLLPKVKSPEGFGEMGSYSPVQRGKNHLSISLPYPNHDGVTRQVSAELRGSSPGAAIVQQVVDQDIDWPDLQTWMLAQSMAKSSPEENLKAATTYIDSEDLSQINQAKLMLERLISEDPKFDGAYVQMARAVAKSDSGPAGLHQAETLLISALQIRPENVKAKQLLGNIYVNQKRFSEAEVLFVEVSRSDDPDLWLWKDWGQLRVAQGKIDDAIAKYKIAISKPMTHETDRRARLAAYNDLLGILERRKDLNGMETLYKQRIAEFGAGSCYSTGYARFMLLEKGDTQAAIDLAKGALNQSCEDSPARQILGLALYVKWASSSAPERIDALNQARIYLPAGPKPLYLLATSDRTVSAARKLIAAGEKIDQLDNERLTALAYALQKHDLAAAKRLLSLGARGDALIGDGDLPVAFLPILSGDVDGTRLMQRHGIDYSKLRYQGVSALEVARNLGETSLVEILSSTRLST